MQAKRTVRPYMSGDHLQSVIVAPEGRISVRPLRANSIAFDIASANHLPANLPESSYNGSCVLDIGRGVQIRASGNVIRDIATRPGAVDQWRVQYLHASQYPTGRELTALQSTRACEVISRIITTWAMYHEADIAQADDIDRNNGARTLEEQIARHEEALSILRAQLVACEEGETFTQYPDLPTKGR